MTHDFQSLILPSHFLANLKDLGYSRMTPIQAQALPAILDGEDVIAQSRTGSGKTAAFGIGLLMALNPRFFGAQAMVLCPTRELADQVARELRRLARTIANIKILTLCGGTPIGPQYGSLEHGAHVIVGTPGRILDHLERGSLDARGIKMLVLDEADRMLDMGFHDQIREVARFLPRQRQTLMFSATWTDDIRELSRHFQRNPLEVTVDTTHTEGDIDQHFFDIGNCARSEAVIRVLMHFKPVTAVVFCNTKRGCDDITEALNAAGFAAQTLHGDMEQRDRDRALLLFSNRSQPILVATDVAARGLDVKDLACVVNADMAFEPEVHIHRVGRTGRAGQKGLALSLCAPSEIRRALALENDGGSALQWSELPVYRSGQAPERPAYITLNIDGGKRDKLRAGDILGALTGDAGIPGSAVGKINIDDVQSFVAIEREWAPKALKRLQAGRIKNRAFRVRTIQG